MDRQVAQLLLQVDANVAVAQRELQNLARIVRSSSDDMNTAINDNVAAHGRLNAAMGNTRIAQMELQHVITASTDAYAAGISPIRILSMEMGRLAEAAAFLGGGGQGVLGRLGAFMSGPWGIAVMLGVGVLGQLILKHHESADTLETLLDKLKKHKEQTALSAQADDIWSHSLDGLIEREKKLNDELEKRLKNQSDINKEQLAQAQHNQQAAQSAVDKLSNTPGTTPEQLAKAEAALTQANRDLTSAQILAGRQLGQDLADLTSRAKTWADAQSGIMLAIQRSHPELSEKEPAARMAEAFTHLKKSIDDAASANLNFNSTTQAADKLNNELQHGQITVAQYAAGITKLATSLAAAAKAAKETSKGTGEFGKQISFGDAEAIAKGAGLTVTSGYRSTAKQAELYRTVRTAENPVARPGTSAHEGANGKWALDIAFAPGLTAEKLKKLYGDQGVTLSAVYKESGHYHIEGSRSQAAREEAAAARAQQKAQVDNDQFARESAQLDAEILQAKHQVAGGFDTQARLSKDEIDAQKTAQLAAIQKQVDSKSISEAQAQILRSKIGELADERKAAVDQRAYAEAMRQTLGALQQSLGFQADDLKFADDMAKTQAEHRTLQLQILDIQYEQKKAELEYQLMLIKRNQDFATSPALQQQAGLIQGQLDRLPTAKYEDQQRVNRGTMDPLHAWLDQIPHDAATITEAIQGIETRGLDSLASSITDVITGTKSLGAAFKDISRQIIGDILQMTIRMLIFRAISAAFGGGGISSPGIGGASFSGGFDPASAGAPLASLSGGFRASGGPVTAGKAYIVGEKRPELFVPNTSGTILPSIPRMNFSGAGAQQIELVIHSAPSDDAWAKVEQVSARTVGRAAPVLVKTARDAAVRDLTRPRLMNGR